MHCFNSIFSRFLYLRRIALFATDYWYYIKLSSVSFPSKAFQTSTRKNKKQMKSLKLSWQKLSAQNRFCSAFLSKSFFFSDRLRTKNKEDKNPTGKKEKNNRLYCYVTLLMLPTTILMTSQYPFCSPSVFGQDRPNYPSIMTSQNLV